MTQHFITYEELDELAERAAREVVGHAQRYERPLRLYPIPRGGVGAALAVLRYTGDARITLVHAPANADLALDDLIDSARTINRMWQEWKLKTVVLLNKNTDADYKGKWIVFPWEHSEDNHETVEDNIVRLLQHVGEDPERGGLLETPQRVAKAWRHWCGGYERDPAKVLKVFKDGAENYDQMIVRKNIPVYSHCEHHMAPIIGRCTVAYIPNGKIVGLSKLDRLVDIFARRLQVQERLTCQIADALEKALKPIGVGVWLSARHLCIESRGVQNEHSETVTTALRGAMLEQDAAREEFLATARK